MNKQVLIGIIAGIVAVVALSAATALFLRTVNNRSNAQVAWELQQARVKRDELAAAQVAFEDFTTQDVTAFINALRNRMWTLQQEIKVLNLQAEYSNNPDMFVQNAAEVRLIEEELAELGKEADFMNYVFVDWNYLQTKEQNKKLLTDLWKRLASQSWPVANVLKNAELASQPVKIKQGQLIGLQGCSGVCSGTHLHFVTIFNNEYRNPCNLLPKRQFSVWGVSTECGTELKTDLIWPELSPWLITQEADDISPATGKPHNALDIIDYTHSPVIAAHDGWYYTYFRSCAGAYICNDQTTVALVCEQQGCASGLITEYWHMDWMMPGPEIQAELVSEYRFR